MLPFENNLKLGQIEMSFIISNNNENFDVRTSQVVLFGELLIRYILLQKLFVLQQVYARHERM